MWKCSVALRHGLALLLGAAFLAGCGSPEQNAQFKFDPLHPDQVRSAGSQGSATAMAVVVDPATGLPIINKGDTISVSFQDLPTPITPVDSLVKEDGTVTLIYDKVFVAAGRTAGQLEREIRAAYVPDYYKNMTPIVTIKDRFYSVGGEVKQPGRQVYVGQMDVLKAIDTAGGFTDFARKTHVRVIRANGKSEMVNAKKALEDPKLNVPIFPGDQVFVTKRIW